MLKTGSLQQMRARQGVPSKHGRIMPVNGRLEDIDSDLAAHLRLFDARQDKTAWREVARVVLHRDPPRTKSRPVSAGRPIWRGPNG